jgi:hypothetical protein
LCALVLKVLHAAQDWRRIIHGRGKVQCRKTAAVDRLHCAADLRGERDPPVLPTVRSNVEKFNWLATLVRSSRALVLGTLMRGILAGSKRFARIAGVRGDAVDAQALGLRGMVSEVLGSAVRSSRWRARPPSRGCVVR